MIKKICFWFGVSVFVLGILMSIASLVIVPVFITYQIRDGTFSIISIFEGLVLWLFGIIASSGITMCGWLFAIEFSYKNNKHNI